MTRSRRIGALWLVLVVTVSTASILRLSGVLRGDTLDYVLGLTGLCVSFSTLGVLILIRRPENRMGRLFLALACNETVVVVLRLWATSLNPASTTAGVIAVIEEALRIVGISGAGVAILLFPTGRLLSRRWRIVVGLFGVVTVMGTAGQALAPGVMDGLPPVISPWATQATGAIAHALEPGAALLGVAFLAAAASLVVRYRRAGRAEREQIKLFGIAVVFVVVLIMSLSAGLPKQMNGLLGSLVWQLPFILPPAAIGYAILRRGLFDIDRVISRTVSYAIVTAILVAGYVALVVVFESVTRPLTGRSDPAVAASTLILAALFVPLRRRVQSAVDHRFNRKRYDAEKTIEVFSARLRDEIDIDALGAELEEVVARTMQPAHVAVWLRAP
jgi:hypothetical protein